MIIILEVNLVIQVNSVKLCNNLDLDPTVYLKSNRRKRILVTEGLLFYRDQYHLF